MATCSTGDPPAGAAPRRPRFDRLPRPLRIERGGECTNRVS